MADYFGVTPVGAVPYNAGYMQTANSHLHGLDYAAQLRAQIAAHQPRPNPHQPKARARDVSTAHQQPAQPRHDDNNDIGDGLEENCFALVSTAELEQQGLKQHPDKIAEAASLNSVSLPAGKYRLGLPAFIIQGKLLCTEQAPDIHCLCSQSILVLNTTCWYSQSCMEWSSDQQSLRQACCHACL